MALDMTPEQKALGKGNFHRAVGKLADQSAAGQGGLTRRQFMGGLIAAGATVPVAAAAYFKYSNSTFRERPVKAGLIGAGDEGGVLVGEHNPAYLQFIAYSDIRPSNQKRIFDGEPTGPRKGFNFHYGSQARDSIRLYEDYRELLQNKEIEAVVIALPLHLHAAAAIAALEAGKHVLCEKLMAWNIRQCKDMIRVQERMRREQQKDLLLSIGHQRHYSLLYAHAVEVINSGALGDIRHIRALWHRNNTLPRADNERDRSDPHSIYRDSWRPAIRDDDRVLRDDVTKLRQYGYKSLTELVRWRLYKRTGGGLMAELGSHQLDACSIFLGKKHPIAVSAIGGKNFYQDDREVEDHVYCTFEFPGPNYRPGPQRDDKGNCLYSDQVTVTYSSISTNAFEQYGECVMGSKGTLVLEGEQNAMLWGGPRPGDATGRSTAVTVTTAAGGRPAVDSSATTDAPGERRAGDTGQNAMGHAPPSRGYREEMEHLAYCIRTRSQAMERDREDLKPRCDGRAAMADAIIALTANQAMRQQRRIVFQESWFDPASDDVPDADMVPERL